MNPPRSQGRRPPRPRPPRPIIDLARRAALDLQIEVREDDAYANLVWPAILEHRGVSGRDAAFATELAYGTLRWRARHDAILAACVDRGLDNVEPALLDALRIGVHQLHNMRVGAHAAVSETVNLVRAVVHEGAAGLTNAVLRKVAAGGTAAQWLDRLAADGAIPSRERDALGYLAIATSHPLWIVSGLHQALGQAHEQTEQLLLADNEPAGVTLVARAISQADLLERLGELGVAAEPGRWSPRAVRVSSVLPGAIPEVATGSAGVQDEASQVVALALAGAELRDDAGKWLDLCAGPGGKAALLAGAAFERGGQLTAVELHEHRAELVRNTLRPLPGRHLVIRADALTADLGADYDRVLVDAPCTGLGALRRRPEARWRRSPADLPGLGDLQKALLDRALELVRPGGLVMYATCSPHLAETTEIVSLVVDRAETVSLEGVIPAAMQAGPHLRSWPHEHGTDGMFAALLRRRV
ncbi:MAG: RsmB/NOP family class I SAM-dependent RNA methyltransferase [Candidatus Nanopelagicales bacterium]